MPELPELLYIQDELTKRLVGGVVSSARLAKPASSPPRTTRTSLV